MNYKLILNKALSSKNPPNILLSGIEKIDKLSILMNNLREIDGSEPSYLMKHDIKWISNRTYKIFDMNHITNKKKDKFFNIINEIIFSKNYYSDQRIIVLVNFNNIHKTIQNKFRVIFEKFRPTTLFILITSRLNSIIGPIISRFLMIRINDISYKEKRMIARSHLKDMSYDKKSLIYDKIYKLAEETEIICYSQLNDGILMNHRTIYEQIYIDIVSITEINKKSMSKIKELSYNVEKYNIKEFHSSLLVLFLNDFKISYSSHCKICKLLAECESNYHKSFNKILSIENCILSLIYMLNETGGNR